MTDDESLDGYCGADPRAARKVFDRTQPPPPATLADRLEASYAAGLISIEQVAKEACAALRNLSVPSPATDRLATVQWLRDMGSKLINGTIVDGDIECAKIFEAADELEQAILARSQPVGVREALDRLREIEQPT